MFSMLAQGGGSTPPISGLFELVIILFVFASSAIGWFWKKLKEKSAESRVAEQRELQRQESLRTGRSVPPATFNTPGSSIDPTSAQDEARRRLQELAQRRRAELEALAREVQQRSARSPTPPMPTVAAPKPQPSRQVPQATRRVELPPELQRLDPMRGMATKPQAKSRETRQTTPDQVRNKPQPHSQPKPRPNPQPVRPVQAADSSTHRRVADVPPPPADKIRADRAAAATAAVGAGLVAFMRPGQEALPTAGDLRRAIVMSELLGPPVGLRGDF